MNEPVRTLIVGATGQVGRELQRSFAGYGDIVTCNRSALDLSTPGQVRKTIRDISPDVILNTAAYTAVDRAESERGLAMAVNGTAPGILAEEALRRNALLVHYSTDYVFDGSRSTPWVEADEPHPLSVYGKSKLAGDRAIEEVGGKYLIFRTSWIYGPHGRNFLLTILRLGQEKDSVRVVNDQFGAPTSSAEIADATRAIVGGVLKGEFGTPSGWCGLYHMTSSGVTNWYEFTHAIFSRANKLFQNWKSPTVQAIRSAEYPAAAQRPQHSVLSCEKLLDQFGLRLGSWEAGLDAVMNRIAEERNGAHLGAPGVL